MREGLLLYNRADYEPNKAFADMLLGYAGRHGLALKLQFKEEAGEHDTNAGAPSFVINRTRDFGIARAFERAGSRVFNSSEVSRICNDKIETHALAARLGLPQVDMEVCDNLPDSLHGQRLGYPVVVKNPSGHGGHEVFLAHNEEELLQYAGELPCSRVLLERLCGRPGVDVRIYILGGEILAAVRRSSASDFRANLSLGGKVEYHRLTQQEADMVGRVLAVLRLDYAGIDLIYGADGSPLFNEIEDAVGSRSLYQLGGFDTADLLLGHIKKELED